jgi:Outer membrane protein beta-barrel domain
MSSPILMSLTRHASLLSVAVALSVGAASAHVARAQASPDQIASSHDPSNAAAPLNSAVGDPSGSAAVSESSSSAAMPLADNAGLDGAALSAASGSGAGQEGGGYHDRSVFSHLTFEAGAGFNAPIGNDSPYITWGGNFTVGGGYRFSRRFSVLGEYQFIDDKLPGAFVAAGGGTGGNAYINSLTVEPVIDLFPKATNSFYVTGGVGWYHKSTNFTVQECCDFFGYPVTVDANSFTSNQVGTNLGLGFSHRLGGIYGDGKMKLFAEARYLYIHTPPITETNGLGTTELIPVTFGVRW